jgi:hypothetical protein
MNFKIHKPSKIHVNRQWKIEAFETYIGRQELSHR